MDNGNRLWKFSVPEVLHLVVVMNKKLEMKRVLDKTEKEYRWRGEWHMIGTKSELFTNKDI